MRSRILSLIFCVLAFSLTMVFALQILNPNANAGNKETSDMLTVEDDPDAALPTPSSPSQAESVSAATVSALSKDLEALIERLAYGENKAYAEDLQQAVSRLSACSAYLRDECSDASGSAYLTVLENLFRDVMTNPFADNSSFSIRMGTILKDLDAALPASSPSSEVVYPRFDTDPNGSFALAMLSVYRSQCARPNSITLTVGGQLTVADAVSDTSSSYDAVYTASGKNYPLHGLSPLLATDDLSVTSLANVLTSSTQPSDPLVAVKGKPVYAQSLKQSGVDLSLLTGPHVNDYGKDGLTDTQTAYRDAGMQALSFSESTTVDSAIGKIAVLSYDIHQQTAPFIDTPKADIQKAKADGAKLVIVVFRRATTDAEANAVDSVMTKSGRGAIDNGADLVINYSQSVIQAVDFYKDHYIVYSPAILFASTDRSDSDNSHSFLFQQSFTLKDGGIVPSALSVTPVDNGSASGSAPKLLLDARADAVIDEIAKYSNNTKYTKYGIARSAIDYICIQK